MKNQKIQKYLFLLVFICLIVLTVKPVWAQSIWDGIETCRTEGSCQLNDFLILGINISKIILRWSGVALLAVFVIGGIMWMTSGGAEQQVTTGKKYITNGVIGLVIIIFAYTFISWLGGILKVELLKETGTGGQEPEGQQWRACEYLPDKVGKTWSLGCESVAIKIYQQKLNNMNCNCGTADGKFGDDTKGCTEKFQSANKLESDGIVGQATFKIYSSSNKRCCSGSVSNTCKDPVEEEIDCKEPKFCRLTSDCKDGTIITGKCPGPADIVCCEKK